MKNELGFDKIDRKYKGRIKFFCKKKGYGFVTSQEVTEDIFFHFSSLVSSDQENWVQNDAYVLFNVYRGPKGLLAKNVTILSEDYKLHRLWYKKFTLFIGNVINEEIKKKRGNSFTK